LFRSFAYARQLRDQREAARKKLVTELEERRFRLESDVLRKRESQITAERVALDRLAQLDEKQQAMAAEKIEMSAALEALEKEQAKHANRSRVEAEARRRLVEETRIALEGQVAQKMRLTAADVAHRAAGDAAELADIRNAVQSKRESDAAKRDAARDEYLRLLEYNKADQAVRRSAAEAGALFLMAFFYFAICNAYLFASLLPSAHSLLYILLQIRPRMLNFCVRCSPEKQLRRRRTTKLLPSVRPRP
jgi:hypothetical protein